MMKLSSSFSTRSVVGSSSSSSNSFSLSPQVKDALLLLSLLANILQCFLLSSGVVSCNNTTSTNSTSLEYQLLEPDGTVLAGDVQKLQNEELVILADEGTITEFPSPSCPPPKRFLLEPYPVRGPTFWACLNVEVQKEFTLDGLIPVEVEERFIDTVEVLNPFKPIVLPPDTIRVWGKADFEARITGVREKNLAYVGPFGGYGQGADKLFFDALDEFPVKNKTVLVVGSQSPWIEIMCYVYGAQLPIFTVDFNKPVNERPDLVQVVDVHEFEAGVGPTQYDVIISFSSLEHDGLGRYGDPLHPNADIERMQKLLGLIKPDGFMLLGFGIGKDQLIFNSHRLYGSIRFPMVTQGWKRLKVFGGVLEDMWQNFQGWANQPVIVLAPENGTYEYIMNGK